MATVPFTPGDLPHTAGGCSGLAQVHLPVQHQVHCPCQTWGYLQSLVCTCFCKKPDELLSQSSHYVRVMNPNKQART